MTTEIIQADKQLLETHNIIYEVDTQQEMIYKQFYKGLKSKDTNRYVQDITIGNYSHY